MATGEDYLSDLTTALRIGARVPAFPLESGKRRSMLSGNSCIGQAKTIGRRIRIAPKQLAYTCGRDGRMGCNLTLRPELESSTVILGPSPTKPVRKEARIAGLAWERLPDPKPQLMLEIVFPSGQEHIFYLGPHAPPRA